MNAETTGQLINNSIDPEKIAAILIGGCSAAETTPQPINRAIAAAPKIIFADEPTGNPVDPERIAAISRWLQRSGNHR